MEHIMKETAVHQRRTYPWQAMEVGDFFRIPIAFCHDGKLNRVAYAAGVRLGMKFSVRTSEDFSTKVVRRIS